MYCLFLDTETTGLSPHTGQIIEIAGVVAKIDKITFEFEIIDTFESLVALRGRIDDKITRITGISEGDLETAPSIFQAQQKWDEFLNNYPELLIVGHSIDFDTAFLRQENWFLPTNISCIDTLDLAKIAYTNMSAVNLEFLVEKLLLKPTERQIEICTQNESSLLKPHRAMYDTICCINLLSKILGKLNKIALNQNFFKNIKELELLELDLYLTGTDILPKESSKMFNDKAVIDFSGEVIPIGMWDMVESLGQDKLQILFDSYLDLQLPKDYLFILLQLISINNQKMLEEFQNQTFKIHTKNPKELQFVFLLLGKLVRSTQEDQNFELLPLEMLITNIAYISEKAYEIGKLTTLIEIYLELTDELDLDRDLKTLLTKIVSVYDFILLALQPLYQRGEFRFDSRRLEPEHLVLQRKIEELSFHLNQLKDTSFDQSNDILEVLVVNLVETLENFWENNQLQINTKNTLSFRYYKNQLRISKSIYNFNLKEAFLKIENTYPNITIPTYFDEQNLLDFLELSELKGIIDINNVTYVNNNSKPLEYVQRDIKYAEFLKNNIDQAIEKGKINLILGGQNSTIRDSERVLTKNHNPSEYLLLGESGSLTKIFSKMLNGFSGVVVVKVGDFGYLKKFVSKLEFDNIYIVNTPYFNISNYWFNKARATGNKDVHIAGLKKLHLEYTASMINFTTSKTVQYIRSYR